MRGLFVTMLVMSLAACAPDPPADPQPTGTGGGGGGEGGGGGGFTLPYRGPRWDDCQPGEAAVDGACVAAGVPAALCGSLFTPDDGACAPILPRGDCAPGEIALLGQTHCQAIAPCGSGPWEGIPVESSTEYVDQGFAGTSDGSAAAPWKTIAAAIAAASPGAIVAVAPGTYAEALDLSQKPVALWGKCPGEVFITADNTQAAITISAQQVEVHRVSLTGQFGVRALSTATVSVEEVRTYDTITAGIMAGASLMGGPTLTVRRTVVEDSVGRGVYGLGGSLTLEDSIIHGTNSSGEGVTNVSLEWSDGINLGLSPVTLRRVIIEQGIRAGIEGYGLTLSLEDVLIRDFAADVSHPENAALVLYGSNAAGLSTLDADRLVVDHTAGGIELYDVIADIEALVVHHTAAATGNELGAVGLEIATFDIPSLGIPASATLRYASFEGTESHGVLVIGAHADLTAVRIRDVVAWSGPQKFSRGLGLESGTDPTLPFDVVVDGLVVERAHEAGVSAAGGTLLLEGAIVRDIDGAALGAFGRGISAQSDAFTGLPTDATIRRSLIDGAFEGGITGHGAMMLVEDVAVREIAAGTLGAGACFNFQRRQSIVGSAVLHRVSGEGCEGFGALFYDVPGVIDDAAFLDLRATANGSFGDGVASVLGVVELTKAVVSEADRAGVATFAGTIELGSTVLDCNVIDLNGEVFSEVPYVFEDAGDNRCGCGEASRACQILSSGLAPPPSLNQ